MPCQLDGLARRIGTSTGNHRHTARSRLHADLDDPHMFLVTEGGRFAGGSAGDQPVSLFCDLPLDQVLEGGFVDFAILKRSNKSGYRTLDTIKHGMGEHWMGCLVRRRDLSADGGTAQRSIEERGSVPQRSVN